MRKCIAKLIVVTAITAIGMYGADGSVGTWKYNTEKSKITVGTNTLKSRTDVVEATSDGGVKITRTEERTDGTKYNFSYTCKYDGKECPVTGGNFDSASYKRVDANTTNLEIKRNDGTLHQTGKAVISKDGKTRTVTIKGTDLKGKPIAGTMIYDKQ
jgi:hypothetical protein